MLITDAPPHGRQFYAAGDARFRDDSYPEAHPEGLTARSVMEAVKSKDIDLLLGHVIPEATRKMEEVFQAEWEALRKDDTERQMRPGVCIVDREAETANLDGFRIVFVLDESGSMSGDPWKGVVDALRTFVAQRQADTQSTCVDIMTVVQFNTKARPTLGWTAVGSYTLPAELGMAGGSTLFNPALEFARAQLDASNATHASLTPMIVFMSDGDSCPSDQANAVATACAIKSSYSNLELRTIGFGSECTAGSAGGNQLKGIADAGGGKFCSAADAATLKEQFKDIARGSTVADRLIIVVGQKIAEMVSTQVMFEHL